jgi:hypothetical protein
MPNLYHQNDAFVIVNGVNHSIVPLADPVFLFGRKFFASVRTRIAGQGTNFLHNLRPVFAGAVFRFPLPPKA